MTLVYRIQFHVKPQALRLLVMERCREEDADGISLRRPEEEHPENNGGSTRHEWSHRFT